MKVILVNGGPHERGCTYTALKEIEQQLNKNDREILEKYLLGEKVIRRRERYETGIYIKNIKNIVIVVLRKRVEL